MKYLGLYIQSYRTPIKAAWRLKADPPGETTLVFWAFLAAGLSFAARFPNVITSAKTTDAPGAFIGMQFATSLLFGPLFLYFLAFCSHVIANFVGGKGSGTGARVALFWSVLLLMPLVVLNETVIYLDAAAPLRSAISLMLSVFFLLAWLNNLRIFELPSK